MNYAAEFWIEHLNLQPHPEGGHYTETYRAQALSSGTGNRAASTAIYFLLRAGEVSNFHRIDADEMWHFYAGDPLNIYCIQPDGRAPVLNLGPDAPAGQWFQGVVPASTWFGAKAASACQQGYSLVGCTVAPGFEFGGFELAKRETLLQQFPQHSALIHMLTMSAQNHESCRLGLA